MIPNIEENTVNVNYFLGVTLQGHLPWEEWDLLGCRSGVFSSSFFFLLLHLSPFSLSFL